MQLPSRLTSFFARLPLYRACLGVACVAAVGCGGGPPTPPPGAPIDPPHENKELAEMMGGGSSDSSSGGGDTTKPAEPETKRDPAEVELEKKLTAAIAPLKEQASLKNDSKGMVISLADAALFPAGKAKLTAPAKERLAEIAKALKEGTPPTIRIDGYTESAGNADENKKQAAAAADAVKAQLTAFGYPAAKITSAGVGPDSANARRIEIVVNPK